MNTLIRNVRLFARDPLSPGQDLLIREGRIADIGIIPEEHAADAEVVDGANRLVLPSLGDVHAHLDSNRLGQRFRPHTADGTLHGYIMNDRANWRNGERSVKDQASYAIDRIVSSGGTRIRTHVQVDSDCKLDRFVGVRDALAEHESVVDSQIVAFPQAGIVREAGVKELLNAALENGADLVGGLDPVQYDRDPVRHLDIVFELCEKHGKGADIHLHERGTAGIYSMEEIARRTIALGLQGRVTISHAFAFVGASEREKEYLGDLLDEAGISVTTVAPAGPLDQTVLSNHRIAVGLGEDGQRDYWSPYGDGDLLRRTWQLAFTNGFRRDADIEGCLDIASRGGAMVMAGARPSQTGILDDTCFGLGIGAPANLILLSADTVTAAVMDSPPERDVYRNGVLVASGGRLILDRSA